MKTNSGGSLHQSADTGSASPAALHGGSRATCIRSTVQGTSTHEATQQEPESSGVVTAAPAAASPTCVHWWVLPMPNGETVKGRCKKCGKTRTYPTYASDKYSVNAKGKSQGLHESAQARWE